MAKGDCFNFEPGVFASADFQNFSVNWVAYWNRSHNRNRIRVMFLFESTIDDVLVVWKRIESNVESQNRSTVDFDSILMIRIY